MQDAIRFILLGHRIVSPHTLRPYLPFFQDHNSLRQITITDVDEGIARRGRDDGYARLSVRAYASTSRIAQHVNSP
jgi:hypothetical protein